MAIYITGDQHGAFDLREPFLRSLKKEDILITLGDWGWCWTPKDFFNYRDNLNLDCLQLFIDGNHENFTYLSTFPVVDLFGGKAHKLSDNIYHLMRGEMYTIEGKKFFCFGGALSIDRQWRLPHLSWWPDEQPTQGEYNHAIQTLEENNYTFDYFLTHDTTDDLAERMFGYNDIIKSSTTRMIQELLYEIKEHEGSFKAHYFAHHHRFGAFENHMCFYEQVLCLDTGDFKTFPYGD